MLAMKKKNFFTYLRSLLKGKKQHKGSDGRVNSEHATQLRLRLETLMMQKQPYLQSNYHMKDMADDLGMPLHQLSAFMNQVVGVHFTEYMNKYRIKHCEDLLKKNSGLKPSLKELAYKCGFNNRNSFTTAFKKFTGHTPSDYVRQLGNS